MPGSQEFLPDEPAILFLRPARTHRATRSRSYDSINKALPFPWVSSHRPRAGTQADAIILGNRTSLRTARRPRQDSGTDDASRGAAIRPPKMIEHSIPWQKRTPE